MNKAAKDSEAEAQVDRLLAELDLGAARGPELAAAASRVAGLGRVGVARLVGAAFGDRGRSALRAEEQNVPFSARDKAAALLACLEGPAARWARDELAALLESRPLNPTERMWATVALRRLAEAAAPPGEGQGGEPLADHALNDEVELILWRDEFAALTPEEQEAVLAPLLQDGNEAVLPLLEAASSLGVPRVDAAVARGLGRFATAGALPLLRELLRSGDPVVRREARESLLALERQGVDARGVFVAAPNPAEPAVASLATLPGGDGRLVVLVARGRPSGPVRFAAVVIDPVELGIAAAWGDTGLTPAALWERVAEYQAASGERFVDLDLGTAQALVAAGEDYAVQNNRRLPPDYLIWRRCIGRPGRPVPLPIVFGPKCSQCGTRLRGGDIRRRAIIVGSAALCARCAAQPRRCVACGEGINQDYDSDTIARQSADGTRVEFLCARCWAKK